MSAAMRGDGAKSFSHLDVPAPPRLRAQRAAVTTAPPPPPSLSSTRYQYNAAPLHPVKAGINRPLQNNSREMDRPRDMHTLANAQNDEEEEMEEELSGISRAGARITAKDNIHWAKEGTAESGRGPAYKDFKGSATTKEVQSIENEEVEEEEMMGAGKEEGRLKGQAGKVFDEDREERIARHENISNTNDKRNRVSHGGASSRGHDVEETEGPPSPRMPVNSKSALFLDHRRKGPNSLTFSARTNGDDDRDEEGREGVKEDNEEEVEVEEEGVDEHADHKDKDDDEVGARRVSDKGIALSTVGRVGGARKILADDLPQAGGEESRGTEMLRRSWEGRREEDSETDRSMYTGQAEESTDAASERSRRTAPDGSDLDGRCVWPFREGKPLQHL